MKSEIFRLDGDITCPKCDGEGMIPTKQGASTFNPCLKCNGKRYIEK